MDSSTSNLEKNDWPSPLHDHSVFASYNISLKINNSKQECASPTVVNRTNPAHAYTRYIPSGHIYNDPAQQGIHANGNGHLENLPIESPQPPPKKCFSRSDRQWVYAPQLQSVRGPHECSNMEQSYQSEVSEPTYSGYQDLIAPQPGSEYSYPRAFSGSNSDVNNDHANYSMTSQSTYVHPKTTGHIHPDNGFPNEMPYYSYPQPTPPQPQYALQPPPLSYLGPWLPHLPTQSPIMNAQAHEYQLPYPQVPDHYQPIPQAPPTLNAPRSRRGRKSKTTASDPHSCAPVVNQEMSFSQKICIICEERPINVKLICLQLCQYCLIDYRNAINLNLLEDCKCSERQETQHRPSSCWRCVVSRCLTKGVDKEAVKAVKLSVNTPADPLTILQEIFPYPEQANTFTPEIDFPPAERALPESASLVSVLKDEEVLSSCYLESGVNFTVWATKIPLFSAFIPQEQMQILKCGFLPVLLVRFAFKLSQLLPKSKTLADLPMQEAEVSLADVILGAKEYLFSLEELEALKKSMTSNECRFVLYLCSADYQVSDNEECGEESIEINRLGISQRYALRQLFELGKYFRDLKFSAYAIQCLCMVLLYENEKPGIPDELKLKMKQPLKEAQNYFRVALRQSNVPDAEYFRMVFTHREILNLAEELRTTVGSEFKVPAKNIVGLDSVITQTFPDFIEEQNNS
ncbi:unnamed protein product [Hymenolepis diminuta]|uniref:NR LBD domain-containing protein n=2 Tax=Hymenolepis diminuta TaxID=6216 RepID=A0A0R3SKH5_HYMDI|nr:unnamed protein product [Hymenolepis diminuta]